MNTSGVQMSLPTYKSGSAPKPTQTLQTKMNTSDVHMHLPTYKSGFAPTTVQALQTKLNVVGKIANTNESVPEAEQMLDSSDYMPVQIVSRIKSFKMTTEAEMRDKYLAAERRVKGKEAAKTAGTEEV